MTPPAGREGPAERAADKPCRNPDSYLRSSLLQP